MAGFVSLEAGMGAGTGNYFIAVYATAFISSVAWALYKFNFGIQQSSDFILRFYFDKILGESYVAYINEHSQNNALLHMEPYGDKKKLHMIYDISLKEDVEMNVFLGEFSKSMEQQKLF
jgi:uncharacterized membrane protein YhiD involved in acid resistance